MTMGSPQINLRETGKGLLVEAGGIIFAIGPAEQACRRPQRPYRRVSGCRTIRLLPMSGGHIEVAFACQKFGVMIAGPDILRPDGMSLL